MNISMSIKKILILLGFYTIMLLSLNSCTLFNGEKENTIIFTSVPIEIIDHNREYQYRIFASNTGNTEISYEVKIPSWLHFNKKTNTISGLADWENVGKDFDISIKATNEIDELTQDYVLSVKLGEIVCDQNFGDPKNSRYILPFQSGETYLLSQSYCPSNLNWGHHNWFAYDFDMNIGTIVIASREGRVIAVKESNPDVSDCSGGKENFVFIEHSDGTVMSYVHLKQNEVYVQKNDLVAQGQELGLSGNSGCSVGPHTHIALFRDRTNYDRQSTIPFNYNNSEGELDNNNGLIGGKSYTAKD